MKKRRIDLILLICLCVSACSVSLYSMPREWADLEEGEHRLYGSEKYKKYTIDNSLIQREKWEGHSSCMVLGLIKSTDYPKYTAFRFWPFYDTITSKIDARERTWSTLGLYYRKHDNREDYMRFFPLYSSLETRRKKDADILFFIRWGERRSTKHVRYFDIYPLYFDTDYNTADNSETGSAFLFIPFVYTTVTDRTLSGTSFHERKNMTLLWYYHSTAEQGREPRTSTTFFFPVIPLFYYHNDPGSRHINVLWLFDRETARGEVRRSMLLPLWYYTQDLGAPGHREETSASLFHYSNERSSPGPDGTAVIGEDTEWYPLLPLYYYSHTKGEGTHRNLLWLLDWRRSEDESLERFWGHPLVYYRPDSYLHVLPLFMSWEDQRTSTSMGFSGIMNVPRTRPAPPLRRRNGFPLYLSFITPAKRRKREVTATCWCSLTGHMTEMTTSHGSGSYPLCSTTPAKGVTVSTFHSTSNLQGGVKRRAHLSDCSITIAGHVMKRCGGTGFTTHGAIPAPVKRCPTGFRSITHGRMFPL